MFSNRYAWLKIAVSLALLSALCWKYASEASADPAGYTRCLADPERWDGRLLRLPLWEVTAIVGPDRFEISKVFQGVPVRAPTAGMKVGDTVSVVGHFRAADGAIEAEVADVHHYRFWKELLGVLGAVLAVLAAPFGFRWRGGRLEERG